MPRRKQTEEIPASSNDELLSADETAEADLAPVSDPSPVEPTELKDDAEVQQSSSEAAALEAVNSARRKTRARKKSSEAASESAQEPSEDESSAEESQDTLTDEQPEAQIEGQSDDLFDDLLDADELLSEIDDEDEMDEDEMNDQEIDTEDDSLEKSYRKEIAQRLKEAESAGTRYTAAPSRRGDTLPDGKAVAKYYGAAADQRDYSHIDESMMWSELRRFQASGIPTFCRVVSTAFFDGEICALCLPTVKKYSSAIVYVPFSEMDIPSSRELSNKEKKILIQQKCINIAERVKITSVNERGGYCVASVRLGNLRARKDAYFRGERGLINSGASKQKNKIIGVGTIVNAYIENVNHLGIVVNIYGARTRIRVDELSYEYLPHPKKYFKAGQIVKVKITGLRTFNNADHTVKVTASVKALMENKTIAALKKHAKIGEAYTSTIATLPGANSNAKLPIAFADLGFNCVVGGNLTFESYTIGSRVVIKLRDINEKYAFGDIIRILDEEPERY